MVWTPGLYLPVRNILDCIRANKIMFLPKELNKEEGYFTDEWWRDSSVFALAFSVEG